MTRENSWWIDLNFRSATTRSADPEIVCAPSRREVCPVETIRASVCPRDCMILGSRGIGRKIVQKLFYSDVMTISISEDFHFSGEIMISHMKGSGPIK